MKYLIFSILCILSLSLNAQEDHFGGVWVGEITQNEGGYRSDYYFEFHVQEITDDGVVNGKTYVKVDSIFATMDFSGRIQSGVYLQFAEKEIINSKKFEGMDWCIKRGQLMLIKVEEGVFRLEGYWQGQTEVSSCIPGKIHLKKGKPRA
ncbi:MAG: hypothetical protein GYB31_00005 [Bacteroidetes bacterium]|nr:hypothetical protein [Bacteroidota bacterium]